MASLQNFYTSRDNNANADSYVGQLDRLWYNPNLNSIYVSDGSTPGGIPVGLATAANAIFTNITVNGSVLGDLEITGNISAATDVKIGGVKAGPGANISNDGTLTIDTANLPLSFGNFTASNNILSIVNVDEDMILATQGDATIKLVGNVEFVQTDGPPGTGNIFINATNDGFMTIYAPTIPANAAGALNVVGSSDGNYQPVTQAGGMIHITGNDNTASRFTNDGFGANGIPTLVSRRARGTATSPATVQSGDVLSRYSYAGWTGSFYGPSTTSPLPTSIDVVALDNFTTTAVGSEFRFYNAPAAGNTRTLSATIASNGISTGNVVATGTFRYDIASNNATVTQLISKSTAVTADGRTGQITTNNASLSQGTAVTFTVNNTYVSATDVIVLSVQSGATANTYNFTVTAVDNGSFNIQIRNFSNSSQSDAIVINFAVIKVS